METIINSPIPFYTILVPLVGIIAIGFSGKKPNLRETFTLISAFITFFCVVSMLPTILKGNVIEFTAITLFSNLDIKFRVDALGIFFALTSSFLWIVTSFYSIGYVRAAKEHKQTRYFMCFAAAMFATMGVAFSGNMFTTYFFYEVITLCTFALVAHKETPEALRGARIYFVFLFGTSIAFQLTAIFLTYHATGTLDFSNQGIFNEARANGLSDTFIYITFGLFIAGIAKAGFIPFHAWLPNAMVAPTPVSALLHAVAVVKTGVFVILKVVLHIFGIDLLSELGLGTALMYFASVTIIIASIFALRQDNLKARLAYSTISQLSYIIFGVALLSPAGITASIMHLVIHAFGKITLFFCAGAIYIAAHKTKVSELDGIGKKMPLTMAAYTLGAFSMIGIPPFGGFITKWYLITGAVEAKHIPIIAVLVVSTILNACYFLPIVYKAFFKDLPEGENAERHEAPVFMVAPLILTALGTLALFFYPSLFLKLAGAVVAAL
ncbi:MAG: monovalent cation/H+ antiporter subunit D family protein [Candidatus Anammoxibacter sp.]